MDSSNNQNPAHFFSKGFTSPFRAASFILSNRRLLKFIIIPFIINLVIFSLAVYAGFGFFEKFIIHRIPQGEAWYWIFINYFIWFLAVIFTGILVFFSFAVIGNLIASPFNEILSERSEEIITGQQNDESFDMKDFIHDAGRTLLDESKKMLLFIAFMILLLLLHLIPIFGTLIYSILSSLLTIFFLTVEFTGYVFSRKHLSFKDQKIYIFSNKSLFFGFGIGMLCVFAIPFFQFLCIPLGVVSATRLCFESNLPSFPSKQATKSPA